MNTDGFSEQDLQEMVLRLAHEIRNPLATIKSAVQLVEHFRPPDESVSEFFDSIHVEIDRIDRVVRDMQKYVRLQPRDQTRVPVADLVVEAVELVADRTGTSRIVLTEGPSATVLVQRTQLVGALAELIDNGLRFAPQESKVSVRWSASESAATIEVSDCGPGIPPDLADRVFRPFFSTSTHGTGLGLNIVARTTELNGGTFRTHTSESGFTVSLELPR